MKTLLLASLLSLAINAHAIDSEPPKKLNPEAQEAASRAFLDYYIRKFNQEVKTGADLAKHFVPAMPAAQKAELIAYYSSLGEAPHLVRDKQILKFQFKDYEIHVRWPDYSKKQVFVEGMSWVFDPSAPAKFQFENFEAKLKSYVRSDEQASSWFIPAADAGVLSTIGKYTPKGGKALLEKCIATEGCKWVGGSVGAAWLMNMGADAWAGGKTLGYNVGCFLISPTKPWYSGLCIEWKKNWDKQEELEKAREPVKTDTNTEWIAHPSQQCPREEKGNEVYDAWIGETVKNGRGDWIQSNKWEHFYGSGKDSTLTVGYILGKGQTDAKEPDKAEAQFIYTKSDKPVLEKIKIKKRKESPDDKDDFITILVTDTDTIIPPEYREKNARYKLIEAAASTWYKTCRLLARGNKIAPELIEQGVKKMQEQPDKQTTSPAPAAVTQ